MGQAKRRGSFEERQAMRKAHSKDRGIHLYGEGINRLREEIERRVTDRAVVSYDTLPEGSPNNRDKNGGPLDARTVCLLRDKRTDLVVWLDEPKGDSPPSITISPEISEETCMDFLMGAFATAYLIEQEQEAASNATEGGIPSCIPGCTIRMARTHMGMMRVTVWTPVVDSTGNTGYWSPSLKVARFITGMEEIQEADYERGGHLLGNPEEQDCALLMLIDMIQAVRTAEEKREKTFDLSPYLDRGQKIVDSSEAKIRAGMTEAPKPPVFVDREGNA